MIEQMVGGRIVRSHVEEGVRVIEDLALEEVALPRVAEVAVTVPLRVRVNQVGPRRQTCPICRRRRLVYAVQVAAAFPGTPGSSAPRCAECWGFRGRRR